MSAELVREQLRGILDRLDEERLAALLRVAELMEPTGQVVGEYDESKDIAIGLFEGPTDLASHVEEIIEEEAGKRGGWTQKDPP
jgi:hypothetical protein